MIEIKNIAKTFGMLTAIDNVSCTIQSSSIFGIVGSNGAGKSTLLRMICGVYSPDSGTIEADGKTVYNNPDIKKDIVFLSDTPIATFRQTLKSTAAEYKSYYQSFDMQEYKNLLSLFNLDENIPLSGFSKGMLRQAMIVIALSCNTKYLIFDETLDGLDAVVRGLVKKKIYSKVISSQATIIISSHSLREIEDFCDSLILIHKGKLIYKQQLQDMDTSILKVQVALKDKNDDALKKELDIVKHTTSGSVHNLLVRGTQKDIVESIQKLNPLLLDVIPLSLEEIFTYELEERGYGIDIIDEEILSLEDK